VHRQALALLATGLLTVAVAPARAQEPDTLSAAQRAGAALARLGAGQRVRIVGSEVGFVFGSVLSASPTFVTLRTDSATIEVPARRVDSLWVREGTHAGRGALIGGAVGAAFLGAVFSGLCQPREGCTNRGVAILAGAVVGAVPGSLLGALIGLAVPKWQRRIP
jgi:hypothetical protein